jgi:hypothetical protein
MLGNQAAKRHSRGNVATLAVRPDHRAIGHHNPVVDNHAEQRISIART